MSVGFSKGGLVKLIVDVSISDKEPRDSHHFATMRREFETGLVPMVGMEIEDVAWKESRAISSVIMNPTEGYYYVFAGEDKGEGEAQCQRLVEMYKSHGWNSLGGR